MTKAMKNALQATSIALALHILFCSGNPRGPAHIVIYNNGLDNDNNDAFPETANPAYADVIVNFLRC